MPRVPACLHSHSCTRSSAPGRLATLASSLLLVGALLTVSCEDDTRPLLAAYDKPEGVPMTLQQTFDFLRQARAEKSYLAIRPYVEPSLRNEAVDFLLAVDAFNMASDATLDTVKRSCPELSSRNLKKLDISRTMADFLEIFSQQVKVLSVHEDREKGQAVISILIVDQQASQEADLQIRHEVNFRLRDGYWVYVPGRHMAQMTGMFRDLTKALERVNRSLTCTEKVTPDTVAYQYTLFVEPTLKRVAATLASQ